jgi:hypothetical protein
MQSDFKVIFWKLRILAVSTFLFQGLQLFPLSGLTEFMLNTTIL